MDVPEPRSEYLIRGKNGIETCITLSELYSGFWVRERQTMERQVVKEILQRLNEGGVRYALIGGVALAHHAIPRATQDLDLMVLAEDANKVRELFPGCYLRGTAIAGVYEYKGTRFDVQPANLRVKAAVVANAVEDVCDGVPVRVATVRDLILLKLWAIPDRPDVAKRMQDQTDVAELLQYNADAISAQDIAHIAEDVLRYSYTREEVAKYRRVLTWLNEVLEELGMEEKKCELG